MGRGKRILAAFSFIALVWTGPAHSELTFWSSGDLMIIYGSVAAGDAARLKNALTPAIKTVVVRTPTGMNFSVAREMAGLIEDAGVTTVAHGNCTELTCPMLFLAGKKRMFSGAGPASAHTVTIGIGEPTHVLADDSSTKIETIHNWWREHTNLSRSDVSIYRESFLSATGNTSKFDRKVFFPSQAKFSKGNVLHCSGTAKSQQLVDCMAVPEVTALSKGIVTTDERFVDARLTEAPDMATPAPTEIALNTVQAEWSDKCKAIYGDYLKQDLPRAFVVSNRQGCHWASIGIRPYERALKACEKEVLTGKECRFYSVDDKIVFTAFGQPLPLTTNVQKSEGEKLLQLGRENTALLLARNATTENGPTGVSDRFSVEGKLFAYLTVTWDTTQIRGGKQSLETRWFNGERLITSQKSEFDMLTSPYRAWSSVLASDIGTGSARVEIHSGGKLIATKNFVISEKL